MIQNLLGLGSAAQAIGGAVAGVTRTIWGDAAERENNAHAAYMSATQQYGEEFRHIANRTWFDSLIDGLNRLPRPMLAFGVIGLFAFAMWNPVAFAIRMEGLALVPEPLWMILFAIIAFYFGARELQHRRDMKMGSSKADVERVVENIRQLRTLDPALQPGVAEISEEEYRTQLADTSKPMSNAAVMEWNKRNSR